MNDKTKTDAPADAGRRDFLDRVKKGSVRLAAVGVGLTAYTTGQANRNAEIQEQLPEELTSRGKRATREMLEERGADILSRKRGSAAFATGAGAAYVAAKYVEPDNVAASLSSRRMGRREMIAKTAEVAGAAAAATGVAGVLYAAGGNRELDEIATQLPATLSEPERTAVEQVIYKAGDANEARIPVAEKLMAGGVAGMATGFVMRALANRGDNEPER